MSIPFKSSVLPVEELSGEESRMSSILRHNLSTQAMDVHKTVGQFVRDLEETREVYRKLIELTRDQSRILRSGVSDELMDLARTKNQELTRLEGIESRMKATRANWESLKSRLSAPERDRVRAAVSGVEEVLKELLALEERESEELRQKRNESIESFRRVENARKVQRAYGAAAPSRPGTLDHVE